MNKVFCLLEHHHVVLEYKQLNDVLKSDANLRLILVGNRQTCQADNVFYTEFFYDTYGKRETYYAFPHPPKSRKQFQSLTRKRRSSTGIRRNDSCLQEMLNIKYRWQIDEFANEFVRKCEVTQSMYSVLGIDASFLDVEGTVSTETSGPAKTVTSTSNSSTRTTIQASTLSRSNPTMVALSLLTSSTPSTTIQTSTPSRSNTITTSPLLVTPSLSGLKEGESEEAFDIFNFALKPVWDCQTARNLFNVDKDGDIREEVRFLWSRLLRASNDNTELLTLLPSGTQMKDLLELDDELKN